MIRAKIAKLGNSRPIFKLELDSRKTRISSSRLDKYEPECDPNDPISILVSRYWSETLRNDIFTKDFDNIERGVVGAIKSDFKRFIVTYGGFKNAKQSGGYRFLNNYSSPKEAINGLVYLYKYAISHGMANGLMPSNTEQKHIDNILALIELMRSKFEPK